MQWLVPWHPVDDDHVENLEAELRREVAPSHCMFGLPVRILGARQDCDDFLYAIEDGSDRVAVVHLTWTPSPPDTPPCPDTLFYPSLEAWIQEGMRFDHLDLGNDS